MKLYTPHRQVLVTHPHDLAVFDPGGDLQAVRQRGALNDQRVIAGGLERIGKPLEQVEAVVMDGEVLPCINETLRVTVPPKAAPMA